MCAVVCYLPTIKVGTEVGMDMARSLNRLTATGVSAIKSKGRYADGGGLYLRVSPTIRKAWVFRWIRRGKATEIGLGAYPAVSLAIARKSAAICREQLASDIDPKIERDRKRATNRTFGAVADEYLVAMADRWTNEKTSWQWKQTLTDFVKPIREAPVSQIDTDDVLRLLKPIWQDTPEKAAKARMRIESVLDYAKAKGWREGENPARWRGHLSNILPARQKLSKGHHPAMPYDEIPGFIVRLKDSDAMAARALEFLIMTAGRTSEVLKATWDEIDFDSRIWTLPAERMKAKRAHRVPLNDDAMEILQDLFETRVSAYVFPGQRFGKPLSNMAMEMLMKRMKISGASPHGFRSSFRDWAGDCTNFPREVAEAALAHKAGDSTEQAYRRSDALEKRRALMNAWAGHCYNKELENVVRLNAAN